ncbi:MAG: histidine kinase [Lewinellaceae bacterium]|nr:histidine kinase [Lewinellaceae bacterium]
MGIRFLITSSLICVLLSFSRAQEFPFQKFIIKEVGDIPVNGISSIAEDDRGFLWLGGVSGLYKYDGSTLNIYANHPNDSTSIIPGPYPEIVKSKYCEALWIASNTSGLCFFDLLTEKAKNFTADISNPYALLDNEIGGIYEDNYGGLWVGTNKLALHYLAPGRNSNKFKRFQPTLTSGMAKDGKAAGLMGEIIGDARDPDILWIGSRFGVYRFDKKLETFKLFSFEQEVVYWYQPVNLQLFADPSGAIWCGSSSTGLCRLDPATGNWSVFKIEGPDASKLLANSIQEICPIDQQYLLILTRNEDAWKLDWKKQSVEYLHIGEKQPNGELYYYNCAQKTKDGDFWLSYQLGLIHLTARNYDWHFHSIPEINPELTRNNWQRSYALSPDKKSLYIGTFRGNGLLVFNLETGQIKSFPYRIVNEPEMTDVYMDALCFDVRKRCWIGSDTGLLFLDYEEDHVRRFSINQPEYRPLEKAHISALASQGNMLWVGTKGKGLFMIDLAKKSVRRIAIGLLDSNSVINTLLIDRGSKVWIGQDNGLSVMEPSSGNIWNFMGVFEPPHDITNTHVTSLAQDEAGHLWASTLGGGMLRLRNADPHSPWFDAYYNNDEPAGNLVYEFVVCDHGKLWLGLQSGMAILDTATRKFVNYDHRDDMFAKIGALIRVPDGRIVSGAHRGFHFFHPDSIQNSSTKPVPYLKKFRVFDKDIDLPRHIDRMDQISLRYDQNHFSFELGALNFGMYSRTGFAYWLEGYDDDWVFSGSRNYLSYTNLPAGHYTLHVKAANKHGIWSEQEKTLEINIQPPYWATWWFRVLGFILICSLGYGVYLAWRQRQRILQAQSAVEYFANMEYQNTSVRDILWDVSHKCMSKLHLEDCVIYLLDETGEMLIQEAAYGTKGPELYNIKDPLHIPLGKGIVGAAALKGEPVLVPDTRKDLRYLLDDKPRLSELAVPIMHEGMVIGVIDSEHSSLNFFKEYHVQVLRTIASLCADKIAHTRAEEQMKEKEKQLKELNHSLAESQLTALRAQMNPHFLFNSLNSINWYIIKNKPAEATRYIARFSRLIRLILEHAECRLIPLAQELEALQLYLEMEAMRFEQTFEYRFELDPEIDTDEMLVPPLIIQPFIENAIWHGLLPKKDPGLLKIVLYQKDEAIICVIEDNGIGRAAAARNSSNHSKNRQSKGLKITESRIKKHNQMDNGVSPVLITDLYDAKGKAAGTRVELTIY